MAAPFKNNFWLLRSKHGRDRLFASPGLLWKAACEYFQWCVDNPLMEVQQAKAAGKPFKDKESGEVIFPPATIELPKMRAFTIQGLCQYLNCNVRYFEQFEKSLKADAQDFSSVITRVRETIYNQKFTGAAAGFLNPNIIARDLGLIERKDIATTIDFENLSDEDLQRIVNELTRNAK